jgi:cytochrome c
MMRSNALGFALTSSVLYAVICATPFIGRDAHAAEDGKLAFNNRCRTCHSVKEGDNRLGPSLHGIIGRKAGSSSDYANYSQALTSSNVVWDEATLDKFIENPDALVPGHNMKPYAGLPDAAQRQQIVEYLKSAGAESK